jgi:hypothetical protein
MGPLLSLPRVGLLAALCAAAFASAQSDRHEFFVDASAGYVAASTDLSAWTDGGLGKLRHVDDGLTGFRLFGEYRGRLSPTLRTTSLPISSTMRRAASISRKRCSNGGPCRARAINSR